MPAKIRLSLLAKELGLTNKETLDLCVALGIGVKTHSSSIEDAQADRVRRKAEREGLKRDVQPEEPPAKGKKKASADEAPAEDVAEPVVVAAPVAEKPVEVAAEPAPIVKATKPAKGSAPDEAAPAPVATHAATLVVAEAAPATVDVARSVAAEAPVAAPVSNVEQAPVAEESMPAAVPGPRPPMPGVTTPGSRIISSSNRPGSTVSTPRPAVPQRPMMPAADASGARADVAGGAPRSPTGRPIPPPPGQPRSLTGRPIPPPPGQARGAGPRPGPGGPGARGPGGPGGAPGGPGGPRTATGPGGAPRPYMPSRPGGGNYPRQSVPGAGVRPGGPGGPSGPGGGSGGPGGGGPGRGGPGGGRGQARPQRQSKSKRRRAFEELAPTAMTRYSKSDAAVPSGEIIVERGSSAQELGPKLNRTAADVVRFLMQQGEMVTATQSLTDDAMELFALEVGGQLLLVDPGQEQEAGLLQMLDDDDDDPADEVTRPPIITVMGHVDHGKTLLLDRFRETNVIAGEAGGITQHIGAYQIEKDGRLITFIDTPGHEAFTAMRARGAGATDIVILVVAANDGVMPQTVEALNHAKAADVPIIVAINKIDIPDSDPNRVMQQLTEYELVPEAWGGDTIMVEVSALQRLGLDDLLEQVLLVADVEDLKAVPDGTARGVVLEANLDIGRGPVATVLIERGTLRVGDPIVAGAAWGTVRALLNDKGEQIKEAGPSMPVQVLGLSQVPGAGDELRGAPALKTAKTVAEAREQRFRFAGLRGTSSAIGGGVKLEDLFEQIQKGEQATLNLLIKADVQGSLEALTESLKKLERPEVKIGFVHRAVGAITENDVQLAATTGSTIIGFNVRPGRESRKLAEETGVQIRTYQIIYQVIEDMQKALVGMLKPEIEEVVMGDAEVREVFSVPKIGAIAGCYVLNGSIIRGSKVRFLRDGVVIWTGAIASLRRFKDDVREVATGFECGIGLTDFKDLKPGDIIETYEEREIARV